VSSSTAAFIFVLLNYSTANPRRARGLPSRKTARKVKSRCAELRLYGNNGVRGTKHPRTLIFCKLVINKHENCCVFVYRKDVCNSG
jgi:hypothetical protein